MSIQKLIAKKIVSLDTFGCGWTLKTPPSPAEIAAHAFIRQQVHLQF